MSRGRNIILRGQFGEALACAELNRRGYLATPFSQNVPEIDILAFDENIRIIPIQVKAKGKGTWQDNAENWMIIEKTEDKRQIIHGKTKLKNPNLIYIYIELDDQSGKDRFFMLRKRQVQNLFFKKYSAWNRKHDQRRVKNPDSTHCSFTVKDLEPYENCWEILKE